ncbi:MAG: FtsW/RodA/SpoVE family cell cycle protein [Oscillospiraceae bacterium]|jgi:rod shape determining protein RodA|nr:FtsW/RodA/SpoVE family cell cycle protein [Oscillospiraceae bacterium]
MRDFFRAILRFLREADIFLLLLCLVSAILGIVLISSVIRNIEGSKISVQVISLILGTILFVLFSYIDIENIADKSGFLIVFSALFLTTLQFFGVGLEETGNRAWLRFFGIGIQPAEVVKITFIIIIARMIANHKERKSLNSFISLLKIAAVFVLMFGLIVVVSADFGSALVYLFILAVMLFIGGVKLRWFALGGALLAPATLLFWTNFFSDRQKMRILAPFIPDEIDPTRTDALWHSDLSVKAIKTGGFFGQGLGHGRMTQSGIIPAQSTDFIFSAAGEELGFIGCTVIMLLIIAIIVRCVYVGIKSNNSLGMLVCTGIAAMLTAHMFENIGMCLGILPVIGISLPFFSYGGSYLVTCFAAAGIVSGIKMRPKTARFRTL